MSALNKAKPYLQRAAELDSFEPVVAYYCRLHALNMLMKARQNGELSEEGQAVMLDALKRSEDRKEVVDLSTGQETMELFATKVFEAADTSDRGGRTDKSTASNFWAAATLMDVCGQFYDGGAPPDLAEKVRYAKYRAVKIRDCIRQGIDPSPPQDELAAYADESDPYAGASAPPPASALAAAPAAAPAADASSEAQQLRDQIARAEEAQRLREQIARAEASAAAAAPVPAAASGEAQRFREQIAAAEAAAVAPAPMPAPSAEVQRLREQLAAAAAARSVAPAAAPAPVPAPAPAAPAPRMSAGPVPPGRPRTNLSDDAKATAKKKAEFASSALDFDDVASAKKLLREALAMIEEPI